MLDFVICCASRYVMSIRYVGLCHTCMLGLSLCNVCGLLLCNVFRQSGLYAFLKGLEPSTSRPYSFKNCLTLWRLLSDKHNGLKTGVCIPVKHVLCFMTAIWNSYIYCYFLHNYYFHSPKFPSLKWPKHDYSGTTLCGHISLFIAL